MPPPQQPDGEATITSSTLRSGETEHRRFEPQRSKPTLCGSALAWGRDTGGSCSHLKPGSCPCPTPLQRPHPHPDPLAYHLHAGSPQHQPSLQTSQLEVPCLQPRDHGPSIQLSAFYASSCHLNFCSRKTRGQSYPQAVLGLKDVKPGQVPLASGFVFF